VIALIITTEGFPLAYEVMPGNTSDKTTPDDFLKKWLMDRGIPTEETLAKMRKSEYPIHYMVGSPRGRPVLMHNGIGKRVF